MGEVFMGASAGGGAKVVKGTVTLTVNNITQTTTLKLPGNSIFFAVGGSQYSSGGWNGGLYHQSLRINDFSPSFSGHFVSNGNSTSGYYSTTVSGDTVTFSPSYTNVRLTSDMTYQYTALVE